MELLSHEVQSLAIKTQYGGIHKPCGHGRGREREVCQMSILLHKLYCKMVLKGGGGQKSPNFYPHGL